MSETLTTPATTSNDPVTTTPEVPPVATTVETNPQAVKAGDWFEHVPKGAEKIFESYKGKPVGDVFKSFVDAQQLIGSSIRLPKADAKPEEREKFLNDTWNKLGRPETPDKYDLGELPALPEKAMWDDAKLTGIKTQLHKMGLNNDQVKGALKMYADELKQFVPDNTVEAAKSKELLTEHFGSDAMYQRNLSYAQKTVKEYADADFIKWLEDSGMGNNPNFIKYNAKIGRELQEHGAIEPSSGTDNLSVKDAQDQINKIMNDKGDLYWAKKGTPGKDDRVKEVSELYKIVAGEI